MRFNVKVFNFQGGTWQLEGRIHHQILGLKGLMSKFDVLKTPYGGASYETRKEHKKSLQTTFFKLLCKI